MADDRTPPGTPSGDEHATAPTTAGGEAAPTTLMDGRYRIERTIGQGAFGRVFLAFDTRLRRSVAIKELLSARNKGDRETYERYLERFEREARAGGVVQHPNVVAVHELAIDRDENYYLVMEYIDGTDLRELLDQVGTLPIERAVTIATEVARGLEAVHEEDIVHRDLKPANIMVTRRGVTKVTDFGIAQVASESQRTSVSIGHPGTPMYMSPEQASGTGYLDGRSDLYSLGLVLYEMLAGQPYARRRQPLGVARPDLSPQLVGIVNRLMEKDPDARYQHAGELVDALTMLSSAQPGVTRADVPAFPLPEDGNTRREGSGLPWSGSPGSAPLGVPTAYGGATSQGPSQPAYPPPDTRDQPYFYQAPPPTGPPTKKRGPWLAVAGAIVVVLIAAIAYFSFAGQQKPAPTATPAGRTATPVRSATTAAAATVPSTATTVAASPVPDNAYIVADTKNLVTYAYPKEWKAGGVTTLDVDIIAGYTDFNPYAIASVAKEDITASTTLDAYTDDYIARRFRKSPDWKPGPISKRNAQIAGQDARVVDFLQPSTQEGQIAPKGGTIYQYGIITLHDNRAWLLGYAVAIDQKDAFQSRFDVLAKTFGFCPTTGCTRAQTVPTVAPGQTVSWTDPANLLKGQYPADWFAYPEDKLAGRSLALSSPDGVFFNVYVGDQRGTLDEEVQSILDAQKKDPDSQYTPVPTTDATIGGEPAKLVSYTIVPKNDPSAKARNGAFWIVNHGGKEFYFEAYDTKSRRADVDRIVASVAFT